ncbi:MAG: HD domain-containing protein [Bacillota bacterium]
MNERFVVEAKKFLVAYLKDRQLEYEQRHPWRQSWEFVVLHCLRVENYVKRILKEENHSLSKEEAAMTQAAAVLHDIGRIHNREYHAELGKGIVERWLKSNEHFDIDLEYSERMLILIEKHSHKGRLDDDFCSQVLKDADLLDELGVMTTFMASNWIDRANPYFFNLLLDRVEGFEVSFCDKTASLLITETARTIIKQRSEYINTFVRQLRDELDGTEMFKDMKIDEYFR